MMEPEQDETPQEFIHFGAGPAKIPQKVLKTVQTDLMNFAGSHVSINEISHRSDQFKSLLNTAIATAKELLKVPDNYKILFMHGGGAGQTETIPLNLIGKTGRADYVITGTWSKKAYQVARKYGEMRQANPPVSENGEIPDPTTWTLDKDASYVYYCANETAEGIEFHYIPNTNRVPLVSDMSSNIFSRPVDISKFGLIFGCAQKNIGAAGITIVIVREDLIGKALDFTPAILDYYITAAENSMYNTPPCFAIYTTSLVLNWIKEQGGVEEMERRAIEKSTLLYDLIDSSEGFYVNQVSQKDRSRMNVTFRIKFDEGLENQFIKESTDAGFLELKGYAEVGGIRVSLYNAILLRHVQKLHKFMIDFMNRNK